MKKWLYKLIFCGLYLIFIFALLFTAGELFFRLRPSMHQSPIITYWLDRGQRFYRHQYSRNQFCKFGGDKAFKIVVIGDSFAFGDGVEPYDCFAFRMQAWLNNDTANPPVQVDLYAYPGYSTYQEEPIFKKVLLNTSPDLVILTMCLNDTEDWTKKQELMDILTEMRRLRSAQRKGWLKTLEENSYFLRWLDRQWANKKTTEIWFRYYHKLYNPTYSGWKRFVNAAHRIKADCDVAHVPLIVVIFPLFSHSLWEGEYPFAYAHDALHKVWKKEGVMVKDLYDDFKNMSPIRLQAIPGLDPHPSEIAHRIAAHSIINYLIDQKLLPSSYISNKMFRHWAHVTWMNRLKNFK